MKYTSIWEDTIKRNNYSKLEKDISTDVLIIGSGITGISVAYQLKDSKLDITIVDSNKIGSGTTSRTTGKLTYLQNDIYSYLSKNVSEQVSRKYLESQIDAIEIVKKIVKDYNINCDLEKVPSYIWANDEKQINKVVEEKEFLEKNKIKVNTHNKIPLIGNNYGISVSNTYYFHPLKYLTALSNIIRKYAKIYENTTIINIEQEKDKYICLTKLIAPIVEYRNSITHINFAQEYSCDFLMVLMCVKFYELFFESNDSQNLVYNLIGDVYLREENFLCAKKSQIF